MFDKHIVRSPNYFSNPKLVKVVEILMNHLSGSLLQVENYAQGIDIEGE